MTTIKTVLFFHNGLFFLLKTKSAKGNKQRTKLTLSFGGENFNYNILHKIGGDKGYVDMQISSFNVDEIMGKEETAKAYQQNVQDVLKSNYYSQTNKSLSTAPKSTKLHGSTITYKDASKMKQSETQSEFEPRSCNCQGLNIVLLSLKYLHAKKIVYQ